MTHLTLVLPLIMIILMTHLTLVLPLIMIILMILPCRHACGDRRRSQLKQVHPFAQRNVQHFRHPLF